MIFPIILSGGSGSRLWPVSREHYPKQFLNLHKDDRSLLQEAAERLKNVENTNAPMVVCNEEHRFLVAEQLHQIGFKSAQIVLEPCGRNTAPALALAALVAQQQNADAEMLVMPADHVIKDEQAFADAVIKGRKLAHNGKLVTFGITPNAPQTGYGYIKQGAAMAEGYAVEAFVEKPDLNRAQQYLESGHYLWNSGIFLFKASDYLAALAQFAPDILDACQRAYEARSEDLDFIRVDQAAFAECRSESIDYAVMEHTQQAAVVPMDPGWSDIGAWDALHALKSSADKQNGNALHGDVMVHDTHNSLIHSESRLVAAVGVNNLVIVETDDAVLVADRHQAQDTKLIVNALKAAGRKESQSHQRVYRPWGNYRAMVLTDSFQVKEIVVNPGAKLSLQMHHHRAEHWVVVQGTAKVTQGEGHGDLSQLKSRLLSEDESTYIPLGTVHRLENPGVIPLHLIEVQTGSYLGEDDIVRYNDDYGRCE
ncbi:MAG: mannose-1-phosphate guanylyltransferase/mannose-6-phosphate isomerase [Halomonas sp.]|jgi:mannose-1-phosphate guanylyltransferase/mannose-1-phosphate guanylyltransferase/mannose-6-phosphate isomerase|uniref:mannose-1-phosphate guanylyltransferase n=1 Tax=Vreelandella aquamarina TaxID=77097 RepID=A0A6F8SWA6_9GAMM|nr:MULTISPECIES: mannose-1-phosphate guanylyltransferase/mannose-6-phosphate isomerase [Halomonas]NQY78224.1 mannose-1-phosphate guanylyltransferase/mannose-6-phosphate isomerase [Halomonas sp.]BCA92459.1 xanthan biosynthesis protein XanB [Halomonas meridiana]HBN58961.1 mannose-1-phosphate guanylyltransferase/mannose-6-phosphate isomerase [Halomonas sp.]|tara:strand:- start:14942 stop:16384 length:1443 start_codon:yes stop_codon:yes gene_type:complete